MNFLQKLVVLGAVAAASTSVAMADSLPAGTAFNFTGGTGVFSNTGTGAYPDTFYYTAPPTTFQFSSGGNVYTLPGANQTFTFSSKYSSSTSAFSFANGGAIPTAEAGTSGNFFNFTFTNGTTSYTGKLLLSALNPTSGIISNNSGGAISDDIDGSGVLYLYYSNTGQLAFDPTNASFTLSNTSVSGASAGIEMTVTSLPSATPEPSSLMLLGTGLFGAAGVALRKRRSLVA